MIIYCTIWAELSVLRPDEQKVLKGGGRLNKYGGRRKKWDLEIISYLMFIYRAGAGLSDGFQTQTGVMGLHPPRPDTLGTELVTDEDIRINYFWRTHIGMPTLKSVHTRKI